MVVMKYDDATWHDEASPDDLPTEEASATHIGMFLAWAIHSGLISDLHIEESPGLIEAVTLRRMKGSEFLWERCDGKLTDEDFTDTGNAFARSYYLDRENENEYGEFFADYKAILASGLPSFYHVADSWENFEKLKSVVDQRYEAWLREVG